MEETTLTVDIDVRAAGAGTALADETTFSSPDFADRLSEVVDQLPVMVAIVNSESRIVHVNGAWTDWFGAHVAGGRGAPISHLVGPALSTWINTGASDAVGGIEQRFERTLTNVAGDAMRGQVSFSPWIVDGRIVGAYITVVDLGRRSTAEAALLVATGRQATDDERERIARSVNDVVTRDLFGAALELSAALQPGCLRMDERVRASLDGVNHAIDDIRHIIQEPPAGRRDAEPVALALTTLDARELERRLLGGIDTLIAAHSADVPAGRVIAAIARARIAVRNATRNSHIALSADERAALIVNLAEHDLVTTRPSR